MTAFGSRLDGVYAPIEKELKEFLERYERELAADDLLLQDIHRHLLKMKGKFLRPAVAIFSSKLGGRAASGVIQLAVAVELIHTATLVHDDIIDDSTLRRNLPSVYSKWGREISVISGDYLYAKSFLIFSKLKDVWINQIFAECARQMCEGEMRQVENRNNFLMGEEAYLTIIRQKTASLFQTACMGGAYLAGAGRESVQKLGRCGFELGMAFQMVDDCLDLTGETESLGKTIGLDVDKSDVTLPLLYLFQDLPARERRALLGDKQRPGPSLFREIRRLALQNGCIHRVMKKAKVHAERSLESLKGVKDSVYRKSLAELADYCLERVR